MTRAAPLPPDERREAIVAAVLPLVIDSGRAISTRQIAEASGIAEGTIFRVFETKSDVIDAAITRALAPGALLADLHALPGRLDLPDLVEGIVSTLQRHARVTHRLIGLLPHVDGADLHHGMDAAARREAGEQTMTAIEGLLWRHAGTIGVPLRAAAGAILALSFGSAFSTPPADAASVAQILLHGITKRTD